MKPNCLYTDKVTYHNSLHCLLVSLSIQSIHKSEYQLICVCYQNLTNSVFEIRAPKPHTIVFHERQMNSEILFPYTCYSIAI